MRHEMSRRELERICYTRPENLVLDEMARPLGLKTFTCDDPIFDGDEIVGRKAYLVLYDPIHCQYMSNNITWVWAEEVLDLIENAVANMKSVIEGLIDDEHMFENLQYRAEFEWSLNDDIPEDMPLDEDDPILLSMSPKHSDICDGGWCYFKDDVVVARIFDGWKIRRSYHENHNRIWHNDDIPLICDKVEPSAPAFDACHMMLFDDEGILFRVDLVKIIPTLLTTCIHEENLLQWLDAGKWNFLDAKVHAAQERLFDGRYRYKVFDQNNTIYEAILDEEPSVEDESMIIDMMIETVKGMN